ncbi:DNA polymerase kappa isoform X1 [Carex littledalei]|uniref:DNA polymerase kappa n=1 Tax=Carex littledalei TaxID=544730 RepID=A0A833QTS0_9POAL|nr:DNA polymerase kappa isoform X1 [Carex littledalei]
MEPKSEGEDRPWQSYHTAYTNAKAGMEGVDKEKVQKVIYEMSKGSKYFENEQRKEAFIKQKIENVRQQRAKLTDKDIAHFQKIAEKKIVELEASRDLTKTWLHTDMDAFYAAVEILDNPSLKGKPLAVGGMSMICTASYEARKFGVRAAMPGFIACKLCPDLIFVPTNFDKYTHFSELTRKVFCRYDPNFIASSLDEAHLNVTEVCSERCLSGEEVATELRSAIYDETGLTCSVGVAPNRMLAKVCSDINKPNGQFILPNDRGAVMIFVSSLPIRKFSACGTSAALTRFNWGMQWSYGGVGLGLGGTHTPEHRMRKSISCERTFASTSDTTLLFQKLADIAENLSNDMQKENLWGRNLTLKLKTSSFEVRTRAVSLQKYISSKEEILTHASKLVKAELPLSLRLMGLRMSQFRDEDKHSPVDPTQKTLSEFILSGSSLFKAYETQDMPSENSGDFLLLEDKNLCELDVAREKEHRCITSEPESSCKRVELGDSNIAKDPHEASLGNANGEIRWIDGYICSECGIELPSGFDEERREHADYHLAQFLQQEEKAHVAQDKVYHKMPHSSPSSRKKQKSSPGGKFIPIDAFFTKGKKNL